MNAHIMVSSTLTLQVLTALATTTVLFTVQWDILFCQGSEVSVGIPHPAQIIFPRLCGELLEAFKILTLLNKQNNGWRKFVSLIVPNPC